MPLTVDVYIPLEDNLESLSTSNCFAFSLEDNLGSGWIINSMLNSYMINLCYVNGLIEDINFTFTSYLEIGELDLGEYSTCEKEHKYGEPKHYPVPNSDIVIDIYHCVYCGHQYQNEHYGDYTTKYSLTYISGIEYLERTCYEEYQNWPYCYSGLEKHIRVNKIENEKFKVCVNDFEIPIINEEDTYYEYGFIMPKCDVEIEIVKI